MSDDLNLPVDETPEVPADVQEVADANPEDVGALRRALEREREERRQAKEELRRIREDETARTELLKEWGYEVEDDAPEDDLFEDDDPVAPLKSDLDELKQWRAQQEAEKTAAQIRKDLSDIHGENEWALGEDAREWIVYQASRDPKGFDRGALERAHKQLIDQWEGIAAQGVERAKKPKPKASHVTAAGEPATEVRDLDDPQERVRYMLERIQGGT